MQQEYNYTPLPEPIPITEQVWPEGTFPLVSTITTAYNHESYIRECIEGFLIQKTTFPVELIIHDDASTDKTADIIREYENKYPTLFKTIYQSENKHSQKVDIYNKFLYPKSYGKYIALCEGDDYWIDPLKLQKQVDFLEENKNCSLVWSDVDQLIQKTGIITKNMLKDRPIKNTKEDFLLKAWFIAPCTWVFRSEILSNSSNYPFRKNYLVGDLRIILMATDYGKIIQYPYKSTTAVYRVLEKSVSHFKSEKERMLFVKSIYTIQMDYANFYNVSLIIKIKIIYSYLRKKRGFILLKIRRILKNKIIINKYK